MRTPGVKRAVLLLDPSHRHRRVTKRTALVIDGYPRSGNTYARAAFDYMNGTEMRVSSHLHHPDAIVRAVTLGLPALVLIREPRATMGSMVQFDDRLSGGRVLETWCLYYRTIEPYLDRIVLADFSEAIGDFGAVVERINERFGTAFKPYRQTPETDEELQAVIDRVARIHQPDRFEDVVSRPSTTRRSAEEIVAQLDDSERGVLAEAEALRERLLEHRGG